MRILVVEDEPLAATVLAKGLREHTYAVDVASDGRTAFEQATINDYDLMIVDVLLPGMNGLELCGRLRANGITAPILVLTARGEPDQRVEGLDAGADDYLSKPYHFPNCWRAFAPSCATDRRSHHRSWRSTMCGSTRGRAVSNARAG